VKCIKGFKSPKYFGRSDDLSEANAHFENYRDSGTYLRPADFATLHSVDVDTAATSVEPASPDPMSWGMSTVELAKRWGNMTEDERSKALPTPLKHTPLKPRGDAEGWYFYFTPPTGGKKVLKKFPKNPHHAKNDYLEIVARGKTIRKGDLLTATELKDMFLDHLETKESKGKLSSGRMNLYIKDLNYSEAFFHGREVDSIEDHEWIAFQEKYALYHKIDPTRKLAPRTANDRMSNVLSMLNWGAARSKIQEPSINADFFPSTKAEVDEYQIDNEEPWEAEHIRAFLRHEREHPVRVAQILTAFNFGFGNKDLAILTDTDRDFEGRKNNLDMGHLPYHHGRGRH
jgi:hypothetical protein